MNTNTTNFGDVLSAIVAQKENDRQEEQRTEESKRLSNLAIWRAAMRPLLTVMLQAKERYPDASIYDIDGKSNNPHFFIAGNVEILVRYDITTTVFKLLRLTSGIAPEGPFIVAQSENPEDLIPTLLEKLAICVTRR